MSKYRFRGDSVSALSKLINTFFPGDIFTSEVDVVVRTSGFSDQTPSLSAFAVSGTISV
jgi:hypothetical protein